MLDKYDYREEDTTLMLDEEDWPSSLQPTRENIVRLYLDINPLLS